MSESPLGDGGTQARKKARTRTGCWTCRRRRKKCNERRPVCGNCFRKGEACEWGVRLSFRDENIQTMPQNHPSMRQETASRRDGAIKVVDITNEVIRDYWSEFHEPECLDQGLSDGGNGTTYPDHGAIDTPGGNRAAAATRQPTSYLSPTFEPSDDISMDVPGGAMSSAFDPNHHSPPVHTPHSCDAVQLAAAQLLGLGNEFAPAMTPTDAQPTQTHLRSQLPLSQIDSDIPISPELFADDGIFLPGSAYLELHSALRRNIFDTARSAYPSRCPTPDPGDADEVPEDAATEPYAGQPEQASLELSDTTPRSVELTKQEEYVLWKNWVDEIAPWLDKFDKECHFQTRLTALAKVHSHLRFSMLALSARQLERKHPERSSSASLALYQEAVHQLVPQLQTRLTDVVASCVVLCVLEMMSCSPQMWRRHLDGCACLIQSLGMNGFSGGLEQALFWCFARMDVCGALISSESTLIPTADWTPRMSLPDAVELFRRTSSFDMYANFAVFLCAHALELFACDDSEAEFTRRWTELFAYIEGWYMQRPAEMRSVLSQPAATESDASASPFPTILFSNAAAISGNQLHHTAALLMLQKKPRRAVLPPKTRPILWHARRICAISICNTHHGSWTNSIQPLWIAGQVMSHHAEHRAILDIYQRIEEETGWGANWRAQDLTAHWGELDEG